LDSPPCTNSSTCYALSTPVALHNGTLINKVSGYWQRPSDSQYLAKLYDNQYVPNTNIAEYAIGYINYVAKYYKIANLNISETWYTRNQTTSPVQVSIYYKYNSITTNVYASTSTSLIPDIPYHVNGSYVFGRGSFVSGSTLGGLHINQYTLNRYTIVQ
jgi:hypothetical protein